MRNFDFTIDLDAFEEVIADEQTLEAFHIRDGKRLLALMSEYEARLNGMRRLEPMPSLSTVRAFQFGFFNNGPIPPRSNGSKEPRRQKTQYAGNIKVWTRPGNIDFNKAGQVAWEANTYLWNADDTLYHIHKMRSEKVITQAVLDLMIRDVVEMSEAAKAEGLTCLFSIPLRSAKKAGQKWMNGHFVCVWMRGNDPVRFMFVHPENKAIMTEAFSTKTAAGADWSAIAQAAKAKGNVSPTTHQARVSFDEQFGQWATDTQIPDIT